MFAMNSILLAGAVAAIVQAGPASQPASEISDEDRQSVELFIEEYVDAVEEALPQGFHIVEAEASGVLSRSSEHCGVGAIRIDVANEEGMEAALFIETAYAVHSQRDASLAVSFPETEMPLIQFCAERGFELSGEAEITSAKSPLEAFSDVLREALAQRE